MDEESVNQTIEHTVIDHNETSYTVGRDGVTKIEACTKSGMYSHIPYIRVWADEICIAEFCQHNIVGVYFGKSPA